MRWQILIPVKKQYILTVNDHRGVVILAHKGQSRIKVVLNRSGANALILGVIDANHDDSLDLQVITVHRQPNTHAETMIYALVDGRAKARINGLIKIYRRAQRVTDFLTERVLLLSGQAQAWAEPKLEIAANDVRASHAATVSSIDKDELFYLMSRGLSPAAARQLITAGFFNQVINRIDNDKIRQKLCSIIKK